MAKADLVRVLAMSIRQLPPIAWNRNLKGRPDAKRKGRKLPSRVRKLPDGRPSLYETSGGRPVRVIVTWELLGELRVPVPPTRIEHPSLNWRRPTLSNCIRRISKSRGLASSKPTQKPKWATCSPLIEQDYRERKLKIFRARARSVGESPEE